MKLIVFGGNETLGGNFDILKRSMDQVLGVEKIYAPHIYDYALKNQLDTQENIAKTLAGFRVKKINQVIHINFIPFLHHAEILFEKKFLLNPKAKPYGIPYDAALLQGYLRKLLRRVGLKDLDKLPVVILPDLMASFDNTESRYHLRMATFGYPVILSIPGITLAPAKPKTFYQLKQSGFDSKHLNYAFHDLIIDHNDPRKAFVMVGLILQSISYIKMGKAFCNQKGCSLYNAHLHHELLNIYGSKKHEDNNFSIPLCGHHHKFFENIPR